MKHFQLSAAEHAALSEAKRNGAAFERPEMLCRTGDGHAAGTRDWSAVTCPQCLHIGKTWRAYRGAIMIDSSTAHDALQRAGVPLGADFHALNSTQVDALLVEADRFKYRKPANANGSRGRYFHDFLQRRAAK